MRFHEYDMLLARMPRPQGVSYEEYHQHEYAVAVRNMKEAQRKGTKPNRDAHILGAEKIWMTLDRPFYNAYPIVVDAIRNTSLKVTLPSVVKPGLIESMSVSFQQGHELHFEDCELSCIESLLIVAASKSAPVDDKGGPIERDLIEFVAVGPKTGTNRHAYVIFCYTGDEPFDEAVKDVGTAQENELLRGLLQLVVGLLLLSRDEKFTKPILLAKDRDRIFPTEADYMAAVARAKRRGRIGFSIGAEMEVSPHVRRPPRRSTCPSGR